MEQESPYTAGKVILVNKPYTWTSFNVVQKIKYTIKKYTKTPHVGTLPVRKFKMKVGHAGTLDPLATGLLIVCTGKETKNIESYQAQEKEYTGTFYIGATTPCFDLEKEVDERFPTEHITLEMIEETRLKFIGVQDQVPPLFSALKIDGRRAYKIARAGKEGELKAREVNISELELTRIELPEIDFRVVCSKGTYIRSLARDFGLELGSGAHLTALCRTRIGEYKLSDALSLEEFEKSLAKNSVGQ
jgi:tRNA pseudouridine55 synthase